MNKKQKIQLQQLNQIGSATEILEILMKEYPATSTTTARRILKMKRVDDL